MCDLESNNLFISHHINLRRGKHCRFWLLWLVCDSLPPPPHLPSTDPPSRETALRVSQIVTPHSAAVSCGRGGWRGGGGDTAPILTRQGRGRNPPTPTVFRGQRETIRIKPRPACGIRPLWESRRQSSKLRQDASELCPESSFRVLLADTVLVMTFRKWYSYNGQFLLIFHMNLFYSPSHWRNQRIIMRFTHYTFCSPWTPSKLGPFWLLNRLRSRGWFVASL